MDSTKIKKVCEKHEDLINLYFKENGKKLYTMIDQILFKLKFNVDNNDFYSLGNEVFLDALCRYDEAQDFNGFLYSCLINKFKTEMTRRGRQKRHADKNAISIDTPISDKDENFTIGDTIAYDKTIESELFEEENKEEWRPEVKEYLEKLSPLQRRIAFLLSDENTPEEICEELHITMKHFENSMKRILADERIRPLRTLVERN